MITYKEGKTMVIHKERKAKHLECKYNKVKQ